MLKDDQGRRIGGALITVSNIHNTNADEVVKKAFDYWNSVKGTPNTKLQIKRSHSQSSSHKIYIPTISTGTYQGRYRFRDTNIDPQVSNEQEYDQLSTKETRFFNEK